MFVAGEVQELGSSAMVQHEVDGARAAARVPPPASVLQELLPPGEVDLTALPLHNALPRHTAMMHKVGGSVCMCV